MILENHHILLPCDSLSLSLYIYIYTYIHIYIHIIYVLPSGNIYITMDDHHMAVFKVTLLVYQRVHLNMFSTYPYKIPRNSYQIWLYHLVLGMKSLAPLGPRPGAGMFGFSLRAVLRVVRNGDAYIDITVPYIDMFL